MRCHQYWVISSKIRNRPKTAQNGQLLRTSSMPGIARELRKSARPKMSGCVIRVNIKVPISSTVPSPLTWPFLAKNFVKIISARMKATKIAKISISSGFIGFSFFLAYQERLSPTIARNSGHPTKNYSLALAPLKTAPISASTGDPERKTYAF